MDELTSVNLSLSALDMLPDAVAWPSYDRNELSAGNVHIGFGNFHHAHQAVYLDQLFNTGRDLDWAIVGAGIKSFDAKRRLLLQDQDWPTTVVKLDLHGFSATGTGGMVDFFGCRRRI